MNESGQMTDWRLYQPGGPEFRSLVPYLWRTMIAPRIPIEIARIDPRRRGAQAPLDKFQCRSALSNIDLPPVRHFWFTSSRGKKIHSMMVVPPAFDESKKYPAVGVDARRSALMWRDQWVTRWNYHLLAQPGYVVLLTNYTGSTGFGEKFAQEIQGDPLQGPEPRSMRPPTTRSSNIPFIDGTRQAAGGASYGGHLANWMQATTTPLQMPDQPCRPDQSRIPVGHERHDLSSRSRNGRAVWEGGKLWSEQNPIRFARKFRTPILLTVGEQDFRVPLNQTLENWSVLQRLKVPSKLIVFPDENHWIRRAKIAASGTAQFTGWLAKYLQPGSNELTRSSGAQ